MPGVCTHDFFWPRKATNGRYYQACRLCGSVYEYDWRNMGRTEGGPETAAASEVTLTELSSTEISTRRGLPTLRLLVELEPAHRVFFQNLADTLQAMPDASTLRQWSFWREILVNSGAPWRRFGESLLGQVIALAVLLIVSQTWTAQELPHRRSAFDNSQITYYKPEGSFPALRGNPGRVRPAIRKKSVSGSRGSIRVAPERAQAAIKAPDIKLKGRARPSLMGSNWIAKNAVAPEMPLASTGRSGLTIPAGLTAIVAPPPEIGQGTSRRLGLPQVSVVAPAPELGAVASPGRALRVPTTAVIGPPPLVQAAMHKLGEFNIGPSAVVAPAPRLPMGEQRTVSGAGQAGLSNPLGLAVPPPPSAPGSGLLADGRVGPLSSNGIHVVPPPPSAPGGGLLTDERAGMLSGGGGVQVVPPAPSIQNVSDTSGGRHVGAISGSGLQAVPPAPSLQGAGGSGTDRRGSSLATTGVQGVPPAPSVGAGGNSGRGGRQVAMSATPGLAPGSALIAKAQPQTEAKEAEAKPEPATEEMPLRLIGLAMALPNSSYFSNYEVYIAERRLRKNLTELVKLVYVYLPYQRRLSEYGVDNSKIYKLRVSRDQTCDESLMQMTWPETDRPPDAHNAADAPGLSAEDKKSKLPCYRTTADDYRKAIARR